MTSCLQHMEVSDIQYASYTLSAYDKPWYPSSADDVHAVVHSLS